MSNIFELGANGMVPVTPIELPNLSIIFFAGYGHDRQPWAIVKPIKFSSGGGYQIVNIDSKEPSLRTIENYSIKKEKRGIGYFLGTAEDFEAWGFKALADEDVVMGRFNRALAIKEEENRKAKLAEEEREKQKALGEEWLRLNKPSWAIGYIVAHLREDESDPMSDYHGFTTTRSVLLGWTAKKREDFSEMRRAIENSTLQEVKYLLDNPSEFEHRENYSGGSGYYLGKSKYHGWIVRKNTYDMDGLAYLVGNPENIAIGASKSSEGGNSSSVVKNALGLTYKGSVYKAKNGKTFYMAIPVDRLSREDFESEKSRASACGGFYLKFGKGFAWNTEKERDDFISITSSDDGSSGYVQAQEDAYFDNISQGMGL